MRMSKAWGNLTRDEKAAWNVWAKSNPMVLDASLVRRVSGRKAFSLVEGNRRTAGAALTPTVLPADVVWLEAPLSARDCPPDVEDGAGVMLRAEANIPGGTKFFIWATPPLLGTVRAVRGHFRFMGVVTTPAMTADEQTADLIATYEPVCGPIVRLGDLEVWPAEDAFIYFRIHEYKNGQLGPGVGAKAGPFVCPEPEPEPGS